MLSKFVVGKFLTVSLDKCTKVMGYYVIGEEFELGLTIPRQYKYS